MTNGRHVSLLSVYCNRQVCQNNTQKRIDYIVITHFTVKVNYKLARTEMLGQLSMTSQKIKIRQLLTL